MDIVIPIITLIVGLVGDFSSGCSTCVNNLRKCKAIGHASENGEANGLQPEWQANAACPADDEESAARSENASAATASCA